jgi:uncharacterized protein YbbC (DUF1343 family)
MALAMEATAECGKKFFILDRVNPITGTAVEAPAKSDRLLWVT